MANKRAWAAPGKKMLESSLQRWFKNQCTARGWYCRKIVCVGVRGFPDLLVIANGVWWLVELKVGRNRVEGLQQAAHRDIIKAGGRTLVGRNMAGGLWILDRIAENVNAPIPSRGSAPYVATTPLHIHTPSEY